MITIPLSQLLDRGVRLEAAEAIAIVQTLTSSAGIPEIDNVEVDSDGVARCISPRGEPTVAALATLLDRLLPSTGIPAPLRYTVARGTGAVEAPPFASVQDFSRALARFEPQARAAVIQRLLSRARPAPPTIAPAPRTNRNETELRSTRNDAESPATEHTEQHGMFEGLPPTSPSRRPALAALSVAAALVVSAAAGYVSVAVTRSPGESVGVPAAPPPPLVRAASAPVSRAPAASAPVTRAAVPSAPAAVREPEGPREPDVSPAPARPAPPIETHAFSPAFSSAGTALFFQTGGAHDPSSAIAVARLDAAPSSDLRIMKIVDDGARNYHAQPSPDGQTIAFDSDRDGERAVYLADKDGGHVRRFSPAGYSALPSWSPDGSRLAYVRAEPGAPSVWNIWVQPIDGRAPQRVTDYRYGQTWAASWFPDGRRIAYSHEDELTILDLATRRAQHVAAPVSGRLVRTPAVSPDGSRIVFQVFRAGVWMLNVRDGSMECVLADPTAEEFAWAPDGRRFAFHSRRDGEWGVYVISATTSS